MLDGNEKIENKRFQYGKIAAVTGIIVNSLLFGVKLIVGLLSSSVAIMADAINNLSDVASSAVALMGFNIASKPADDEHPFGHGRIEYVSALVISVIIIALGIDFLKEGVMRIFKPTAVSIDTFEIVIIILAIFAKVGLYFFYTAIGKKINSLTLKAAAFDSLSDTVSTIVVLLALLIDKFTGWQLDGYAGTIVSILIITGGIMLVKESMNPLLGEMPDHNLVSAMEKILLNNPQIHGIHDIIIHSYGPNRYFATAHAEVEQSLSSLEVHNILEQAEIELAKQLPVTLVLHCDPFDIENQEVKKWRARVENIFGQADIRLKLYDFRIELMDNHTVLHFHLLIPRDYSVDKQHIYQMIGRRMREFNEPYKLKIEFINSFV